MITHCILCLIKFFKFIFLSFPDAAGVADPEALAKESFAAVFGFEAGLAGVPLFCENGNNNVNNFNNNFNNNIFKKIII